MGNKGAIGILAILFWLYSEHQRKKAASVRYIKKLPFNYHAVTLPPFGIWVAEKEKANKKLLEHELIHWSQFQRMGLLQFGWKYLSEVLQNGYDANALEIEARQIETPYCRRNYTKCVQSGSAKTVFNPYFRSNIQ